MRLFIALVVSLSVMSVVVGERAKKEKPKLPPILKNRMRITAEITLKCALHKKYDVELQLKESDHLFRDDIIGHVWKLQVKKNKAKDVFVWVDAADDGWFDDTLEVFFKVKHNCTPNKTFTIADVPQMRIVTTDGFANSVSRKLRLSEVRFKAGTTYQLPLERTNDTVWNLEHDYFQGKIW